MTISNNAADNARSNSPAITVSRSRELIEHIGYLTLIALWYVAVYYGTKALVAWVIS